MEKFTYWSEAATNIWKALDSLKSALQSNKNAWIEVQKNGEQDYPIKIKNPELDNIFNWTMLYGNVSSSEELKNKKDYFNETERELTHNYTAEFANGDSREKYIKNREVVKGLCNGVGRCTPVHIEDAQKHRDMFVGDDYKYRRYCVAWKPEKDIPYWVVDKSIGKVFVVCHNDEENTITEKEMLVQLEKAIKEMKKKLK